jgi:hypothetical protein
VAGAVRAAGAGRRFRLASPRTALVLGGFVLVVLIAAVPLARLAHQSLNSSGGSVPVWVSGAFAVVGFVLAWRKPGNRLGWVILTMAAFFALSEDASFYTVADYRLRHGTLPLGWLALLAQPGWAPAIVLLGVTVLLFPDGQPPSPRWRWLMWVYLAVAALWIAGTVILTFAAIYGHHIQVDPGGNLLALSGSISNPGGWWGVVQAVFFPLLAACWLASLAAQALSYRRSSGERRQQLKWLLAGSAVAAAGLGISFFGSGQPSVTGVVSVIGFLAIPLSIAVAVLRYRLFDIDRIISRTLAYAIVTGLLVGVYAGIVLLATRVVSITSTVAVAGSTLAAAALFSPLRIRVQRMVDRRFNRARYDADRTVAAFALRLQDAVDPETARAELLAVVHRSLEPAQVSLWISQHE